MTHNRMGTGIIFSRENHFKQEQDCDKNKQKKRFEVLYVGYIYTKKRVIKIRIIGSANVPNLILFL